MKLSKLRAATQNRHLAGQTIPRQDSTSFGMRNALKRAAGGACMGEARGEVSRPNLAKAGIRRASGGPVKRQDGGPIGNPGRLSDDSKKAVKKLDDVITAKQDYGPMLLGGGAGIVAASRKLLPKMLAAPVAAFGASGMATKGSDIRERDSIKQGLVKPGEEDRKHGGRIFGKSKKPRKDDDDEDC